MTIDIHEKKDGKTVPLDGTLMRESTLGGNSDENLGSKANGFLICSAGLVADQADMLSKAWG